MSDYVIEGVKWGSSAFGTPGGTITWYADSSVPSYFLADLSAAFSDWSHHANIQFTETNSASANVTISLSGIDGPDNTLGYANYIYSGDVLQSASITFDNGEGWHQSGSRVVTYDGVDLLEVALHEIGHSIGLDHYNAGPAIMNATLDPSVTDLTQSDIDGVQAIYGAAAPTPGIILVGNSSQSNQLSGTAGDDQLIGGLLADTLNGGDGNDNLTGLGGADHLDGGVGFDYARYEGSAGAVNVRLDGSVGIGGDAQGDTFTSIEGLVGSKFGDILVGSQGANVLYGLDGDDSLYGDAGNDTIYGGAGNDHLNGGVGADVLDGGDGFDFARYDYATSGVTARLDGGAGQGEAAGDVFVSIEGLVGSQQGDVLVGNAGTNTIYGLGGNDDIYGGAGDDHLDGGFGNDNLTGGPGNDVLVGGPGDDNFRFNLPDLIPGNHDVITDFGLVSGNNDMLILPNGAQITSVDTANGALLTFHLPGGDADLLVQNITVAQLANHYMIV